ncbi:putative triacylglycerol lipase [Medicago truncatula]|uniref:Putative triacylglycerol lipase n=1 Tax=Medicago truncatula TaxID=3880 RepID=A0A396GRW4_MEDTR|nr:putative triacylglycerol lipase [Medicago truncatula]
MAGCFSFTASHDRCYRFSFSNTGLKSTTTGLGNTTIMHCWVPKSHKPNKPSLLLLHGMGANAMWQWNEFISQLTRRFNIYVPDLLFFGEAHTSKPNRTESFQAQCVAALMEAHCARRMNVVGVSYGGFVGGESGESCVLLCWGLFGR